MGKSRWTRLREATAATAMPALLRGQDDDADDIQADRSGDGDDDDTSCPTCNGQGITNGTICPMCWGSGSVMKEATADTPTMCAVCLDPHCDVEDVQRVREAVLTAAARKVIPKSKFAIPDKAPGSGSYPIHDRAHAIAALSRSSGKPEEGQVKAAVYKAYPDLKSSKEAEPFGGKKAPPFGKEDDEEDAKGGKTKDGKKTKESDDTLLGRLETLEQAVVHDRQQLRSLRESKPGSMVPTFFTPTRVKTSDGREGYAVTLIREGAGNSEDDQWYSADSVRELCESGVCEGMQAYSNHPDLEEEEKRPERDVKELIGTYADVKLAESGGKVRADAVLVPLTLDEHHPRYGWVVTLAEAAARNSSQQPICGISLYGLSAGDDVDRPDGTFGRVVSLIRPMSGDVVTNAGAGGGFIRQLMESARALRQRSREEHNPMKLMAYQSAMREAVKRVREATSDDERVEALNALAALETEKIDNVPDSIEQLQEAAPGLVDRMRESVTAEIKEADGDLKVQNDQLRSQLREAQTTLGGLTEAIGITEALREAGIEDPVELRHFAGMAQQRQLRESKDIKEMVQTEHEYAEAQHTALLEKMRESFDLDSEVEGAIARVPASALPSDGGVSALREVGIPILDAE